MPCMHLVILLYLSFLPVLVTTKSVWIYNVNQQHESALSYIFMSSYLYKDGYVTFLIECDAEKDTPLLVSWILEKVDCMEEMYSMPQKTSTTFVQMIPWLAETRANKSHKMASSLQFSKHRQPGVKYIQKQVQIGNITLLQCGFGKRLSIPNESRAPYFTVYMPMGSTNQTADVKTSVEITQKEQSTMANRTKNQVVRVWADGMYHFLFNVRPAVTNTSYEGKVIIQMAGDYGYLSAIEWPLYPYSGVMAFLYLLTGTGWLLLWAWAHQHSTKMHVLIGSVAAIGGGASTLLFVEKCSLNLNGTAVIGIKWFCELLEAGQTSLLQMLLMVVSTGYGITRPMLSRGLTLVVLLLAAINFITQIVYFVVLDEELKIKYDHPSVTKAFQVLHIAVQVIIAGWIMIAAINTFVHLCKRKHSRKIMIFSIFMGSCILAFVGIVIMFSLSYGWLTSCRKNWQLEWLFGSFWQMESLCLLWVLMWLWRPVDKAQSYAFSPLGDSDGMGDMSDEEEDIVLDTANMNKTKLKLEII